MDGRFDRLNDRRSFVSIFCRSPPVSLQYSAPSRKKGKKEKRKNAVDLFSGFLGIHNTGFHSTQGCQCFDYLDRFGRRLLSKVKVVKAEREGSPLVT
jgi:hypothetical protein